MRLEIIIASLGTRVRERTNLVLIALVGGIFGLFRLMVDMPKPGVGELLFPFALLFAHLALSPIPWQWTGNDAPRVGLGRGFFQALCFNTAWVGLVLFVLFHFAAPPEPAFFRNPPLPLSMPQLPRPPRPFNPSFGLALINVAFAIVFGWVFAEKEATEVKERLTADLLRQSQSKALQNQLEPHVLYNALSSLSELVYEDPLAAEEVITRLADLYRMLTVHGKADLIPLAQERKLVEAYLAMEQMRLGDRLAVTWNWPEYADAILLPPLFLQPLVENAIKHGISPSDRGGTILIACSRSGSSVCLAVENTGCTLGEGLSQGVGLSNLEARLALRTEAPGTFSLLNVAGWTVAKVQWLEGTAA
jgi:hypothetical protein